mmetsp:Transcript_28227/g.43290  ORF Transcript_28227/g.43290 Transcript_28227/m.43290 type:complete len:230 (+) Transcript_28227:2636-3325(+)
MYHRKQHPQQKHPQPHHPTHLHPRWRISTNPLFPHVQTNFMWNHNLKWNRNLINREQFKLPQLMKYPNLLNLLYRPPFLLRGNNNNSIIRHPLTAMENKHRQYSNNLHQTRTTIIDHRWQRNIRLLQHHPQLWHLLFLQHHHPPQQRQCSQHHLLCYHRKLQLPHCHQHQLHRRRLTTVLLVLVIVLVRLPLTMAAITIMLRRHFMLLELPMEMLLLLQHHPRAVLLIP